MNPFSVIIVTYNSASTIRACLAPLAEMGEVEVIVVDNASHDDTAVLVADEFPRARLIASPENLGFARACNVAAAVSTAPYLLFLNPDAAASPQAVRALVTFLARHPEAAIAGARLVDPLGRPHQSMGDRPSLWRLVLDKPLALLARSAGPNGPRRWLVGALSAKYRLPERPERVAFVLGAALCCRRLAWEQAGGFDEAFFVYCEEVDLCLRVARAGWEVWHIPEAVVTHHSGASFAGDYDRRRQAYYESLCYLFRKHNGRVPALVLEAALRVYRGLRLYRLFAHDRIGRALPPQ